MGNVPNTVFETLYSEYLKSIFNIYRVLLVQSIKYCTRNVFLNHFMTKKKNARNLYFFQNYKWFYMIGIFYNDLLTRSYKWPWKILNVGFIKDNNRLYWVQVLYGQNFVSIKVIAAWNNLYLKKCILFVKCV